MLLRAVNLLSVENKGINPSKGKEVQRTPSYYIMTSMAIVHHHCPCDVDVARFELISNSSPITVTDLTPSTVP